MSKKSEKPVGFISFGAVAGMLTDESQQKQFSKSTTYLARTAPIYSGPDPELAVIAKRLLKKDQTTKLKAISELATTIATKGITTIAEFLPFFVTTFGKLSVENNRFIREQLLLSLESIVDVEKRLLSSYMQALIGPWWLLTGDPIADVAKQARSLLFKAVPAKKRIQVLLHLFPPILVHWVKSLSITPDSFQDSGEEAHEKVERIITSAINSIHGYISFLPKDDNDAPLSGISASSDIVEQIPSPQYGPDKVGYADVLAIASWCTWMGSESPLIRNAAHQLLATVSIAMPSLLQFLSPSSGSSGESKLFCKRLLGLLQHSQSGSTETALLAFIRIANSYPQVWNRISVPSQLIPRLKALATSSSIAVEYVLPILASIPVERMSLLADANATDSRGAEVRFETVSAVCDLVRHLRAIALLGGERAGESATSGGALCRLAAMKADVAVGCIGAAVCAAEVSTLLILRRVPDVQNSCQFDFGTVDISNQPTSHSQATQLLVSLLDCFYDSVMLIVEAAAAACLESELLPALDGAIIRLVRGSAHPACGDTLVTSGKPGIPALLGDAAQHAVSGLAKVFNQIERATAQGLNLSRIDWEHHFWQPLCGKAVSLLDSKVASIDGDNSAGIWLATLAVTRILHVLDRLLHFIPTDSPLLALGPSGVGEDEPHRRCGFGAEQLRLCLAERSSQALTLLCSSDPQFRSGPASLTIQVSRTMPPPAPAVLAYCLVGLVTASTLGAPDQKWAAVVAGAAEEDRGWVARLLPPFAQAGRGRGKGRGATMQEAQMDDVCCAAVSDILWAKLSTSQPEVRNEVISSFSRQCIKFSSLEGFNILMQTLQRSSSLDTSDFSFDSSAIEWVQYVASICLTGNSSVCFDGNDGDGEALVGEVRTAAVDHEAGAPDGNTAAQPTLVRHTPSHTQLEFLCHLATHRQLAPIAANAVAVASGAWSKRIESTASPLSMWYLLSVWRLVLLKTPALSVIDGERDQVLSMKVQRQVEEVLASHEDTMMSIMLSLFFSDSPQTQDGHPSLRRPGMGLKCGRQVLILQSWYEVQACLLPLLPSTRQTQWIKEVENSIDAVLCGSGEAMCSFGRLRLSPSAWAMHLVRCREIHHDKQLHGMQHGRNPESLEELRSNSLFNTSIFQRKFWLEKCMQLYDPSCELSPAQFAALHNSTCYAAMSLACLLEQLEASRYSRAPGSQASKEEEACSSSVASTDILLHMPFWYDSDLLLAALLCLELGVRAWTDDCSSHALAAQFSQVSALTSRLAAQFSDSVMFFVSLLTSAAEFEESFTAPKILNPNEKEWVEEMTTNAVVCLLGRILRDFIGRQLSVSPPPFSMRYHSVLDVDALKVGDNVFRVRHIAPRGQRSSTDGMAVHAGAENSYALRAEPGVVIAQHSEAGPTGEACDCFYTLACGDWSSTREVQVEACSIVRAVTKHPENSLSRNSDSICSFSIDARSGVVAPNLREHMASAQVFSRLGGVSFEDYSTVIRSALSTWLDSALDYAAVLTRLSMTGAVGTHDQRLLRLCEVIGAAVNAIGSDGEEDGATASGDGASTAAVPATAAAPSLYARLRGFVLFLTAVDFQEHFAVWRTGVRLLRVLVQVPECIGLGLWLPRAVRNISSVINVLVDRSAGKSKAAARTLALTLGQDKVAIELLQLLTTALEHTTGEWKDVASCTINLFRAALGAVPSQVPNYAHCVLQALKMVWKHRSSSSEAEVPREGLAGAEDSPVAAWETEGFDLALYVALEGIKPHALRRPDVACAVAALVRFSSTEHASSARLTACEAIHFCLLRRGRKACRRLLTPSLVDNFRDRLVSVLLSTRATLDSGDTFLAATLRLTACKVLDCWTACREVAALDPDFEEDGTRSAGEGDGDAVGGAGGVEQQEQQEQRDREHDEFLCFQLLGPQLFGELRSRFLRPESQTTSPDANAQAGDAVTESAGLDGLHRTSGDSKAAGGIEEEEGQGNEEKQQEEIDAEKDGEGDEESSFGSSSDGDFDQCCKFTGEVSIVKPASIISRCTSPAAPTTSSTPAAAMKTGRSSSQQRSSDPLGDVLLWLLCLQQIEAGAVQRWNLRARCGLYLRDSAILRSTLHCLLDWAGDLAPDLEVSALLQRIATVVVPTDIVDPTGVGQLANPVTNKKDRSSPSLSPSPGKSRSGRRPARPTLHSIEQGSLAQLATYAVFRTICTLPAMFRGFWNDECTRLQKTKLSRFTEEAVRGALVRKEMALLETARAASQWNPDEFVVRGSAVSGEVTAALIHEDTTIEITIKMPPCYPLKNVEVSCTSRIGVSDGRWRRWVLQMTQLLAMRDGSVLDAVLLWKANIERELDGVEPCPICYNVLHAKNLCLPTLACPTCNNKFHSPCLYTWFRSSGKSKCVICQQPFFM